MQVVMESPHHPAMLYGVEMTTAAPLDPTDAAPSPVRAQVSQVMQLVLVLLLEQAKPIHLVNRYMGLKISGIKNSIIMDSRGK